MSAADGGATDAWPVVGTPVRLVRGGAGPVSALEEVVTAVQEVTDERLAVAEPRELPTDESLAVGEVFELQWAGQRGLQVLSVRLVERGARPAPVWWCEPVGEVLVEQRRAHVRARAAWQVHVVLTPVGPDAVGVEGVVADLSEGGVRARLHGWEHGAGVPVVVRMSPAGDDADDQRGGAGVVTHPVHGTVLHEAATADPAAAGGTRDVHVQFDSPVPGADELRALVFAWQRAARRAALD